MTSYIGATLALYYLTVKTDKFGQVHQSELKPIIFGDKAEKVIDFCRNNPGTLSFSTYGSRSMGTYQGFQIDDPKIRHACRNSLKLNPSYRTAMSSY
jgi:hypothetical protein